MSFPVTSGSQIHSGNLIPVIWSRKFMQFFYMATILAAISNTDYEGEIANHGDEVDINVLPVVTSRKYIKGQKLIYDDPKSETVKLLIDQARYFAFNASYIDKKQASIEFIEKWADHYSQTLKRDIESDVLSTVYANAATANTGATAGADTADIDLGSVGAPLVLTKLNIIDAIVDWGDVLDQQSVPDTERTLELPTWACAMIKKSELRDASITGDNKSIVRNGRIGMIDRFEIFATRNLSTGTDDTTKVWNAMGNHKSAITFASQLTASERLPAQGDFGTLVRTLQSYGFEAIKPESLMHLYLSKG